MNEYEKTAATMLLDRLHASPDLAHPASRLRANLSADVVAAIAAREAEYCAYNNTVSAGAANLLSPDAAEYWAECRKMLAYGRLAHAKGNRAMENALSLKCERLDESFAARVPQAEQGMFLVHERDGRNWDDRWFACHDFYPPILRPEFVAGIGTVNAARDAQIDVLTDLLAPPVVGPPPPYAEKLRRLALDR